MVNGVNVVGYARVSTDDKGQNIEGQKREILKWAEARNNNVVGFYFDEGISGATFPRPGLSMALLQIQLGDADYLVCYDQSRLTRDADNHLWQIRRFAPNICYVADGDLEPNTLPTDLLHAIKGVTDKEERRIIGLRTRIGMETKKAQGVHLGRPLKLALREEVEGSNKGRIVPGKTTIITRNQLLTFASMGMTPNHLAVNIFHTTSATVYSLLDRNDLTKEYYNTLSSNVENTKKHDFDFKGV